MNKKKSENPIDEEIQNLAEEEGIDVDEDLKNIAKNHEKNLDEEYTIDDEVEQLFTEKERQIVENKLKALGNLQEHVRMSGSSEGHELHPAYSFIAGSGLISFGFLYQNGAAFGLAFLGLGLTLFDLQKAWRDKPVNRNKLVKIIQNHPLGYILGMMASSILYMNAGFKTPEIELGLLASIVSAFITS